MTEIKLTDAQRAVLAVLAIQGPETDLVLHEKTLARLKTLGMVDPKTGHLTELGWTSYNKQRIGQPKPRRGRPPKDGPNRDQFSIALPPDLKAWLDLERGKVSRADFIIEILEQHRKSQGITGD